MSFERMFEPLARGPFFDWVLIYRGRIVEAIEDQVLLQLTYRGLDRTVEPYELGKTELNNYVLRCYQVGGSATGIRVAAWKTLRLDYISYLEITAVEFPARSDYFSLPGYWTFEPYIAVKRG